VFLGCGAASNHKGLVEVVEDGAIFVETITQYFPLFEPLLTNSGALS
jgi:hypothetical protein